MLWTFFVKIRIICVKLCFFCQCVFRHRSQNVWKRRIISNGQILSRIVGIIIRKIFLINIRIFKNFLGPLFSWINLTITDCRKFVLMYFMMRWKLYLTLSKERLIFSGLIKLRFILKAIKWKQIIVDFLSLFIGIQKGQIRFLFWLMNLVISNLISKFA